MSLPDSLANPVAFQTPDCIRCLRRKLNAIGVASFFVKDGIWVLADYEDSMPCSDAEFRVCYMLKAGLPQVIADSENGLKFNSEEEAAAAVPELNQLFDGCVLMGARTVFAGLGGVRVAWRESYNPFTQDELEALACFGECPKDCEGF